MASCGKCLHKEVCVYYRYYKTNAEKCLNFKEMNMVKTTQTNADGIRAMSDEELAKEMRYHAFALATCSEKAWLEWLQSPAE